jgi:type I restriction enzyme S subunit
MNFQKLDTLCELVRGSSPRPQGDKRYYGGDIPRLMVEDVTRDGMYVTPTVDFLTKEGAKLSRPMSKGELTMVVSGSPGVPAILNVDACIHDGFVGFRKLNEQKIATEFLYFWFLFRLVENDKHATGAIFRNLTTDQIKNFDVPILTVDQQQQIATHLKAQLAEVEKARQAAGVQLRDARLLRSRILNDIFAELNSIPKKKLGEYAKTTSGSTPSRGNKQYWEAAEIPWVKTGEVAFAPINATEEAISTSALADCSLTLLPPKTILIAMYGQGKTRGQSAILEIAATTNQACFAILPNETWVSEFLYLWLRASYQDLRDLSEDRGGNQANLNGALLNALEIPAPNLDEQKKIVVRANAALSEIATLENSSKAALEDLLRLPNRILAQAFEL